MQQEAILNISHFPGEHDRAGAGSGASGSGAFGNQQGEPVTGGSPASGPRKIGPTSTKAGRGKPDIDRAQEECVREAGRTVDRSKPSQGDA
jgi:hypothetical protein